MSEIVTTNDYHTTDVGIKHLEEIKKDMGDTELIGYSVNESEDTVTVIVDVSDITKDLRYIQ